MKTQTPKLKPKTVQLLRRIQRAILAEPKQFQMWTWFHTEIKIPNCHTAACIGGWALALKGKLSPAAANRAIEHEVKNINYEATEALALTRSQAHSLFVFEFWPEKFRRRLGNNAKQAVARIDHFIATGGNE